MICPTCKDTPGRVVLRSSDGPPLIRPCPDCQGARMAYCCEGVNEEEKRLDTK